MRPASFSRRNGNARPPKLEPPPVHPTITSGVSPASSSCSSASSPMIVWCSSTWLSTEPERVPGARVLRGHLDRLADRDAERAGVLRVLRQQRASRGGLATGSGTPAPRTSPSSGGGRASGRTRRQPARPCTSRPNSAPANARAVPHWPAPVSVVSLRDALGRVVVRLRHGGVRLVRAGRRDALVLVVDPGRGAERLLEAVRPEQRRGPPLAVDVQHRAGDLDVAVAGHLLARSAPSGTAARGRRGRPAASSRGAAAAVAAWAGPRRGCTRWSASGPPTARTCAAVPSRRSPWFEVPLVGGERCRGRSCAMEHPERRQSPVHARMAR